MDKIRILSSILVNCWLIVISHSVKSWCWMTFQVGEIKIWVQWTDLLNGFSQPLLAFHHLPERDTCVHIHLWPSSTHNTRSCWYHHNKVKTKEESWPVFPASQAEGELCRAVRSISGRHNGVSSRREMAGQADILGVAVRDTAGHRILVSWTCQLRLPFSELDS